MKRASERPLTCPPGEAGRVSKGSNRGRSALANHRSFVPGSGICAGGSKGAPRLHTPRWTTDGQCTDELKSRKFTRGNFLRHAGCP